MRTLKITLGPAYDEVAEQIEARLRPVDMMEVLLVAQIVRATWRLDNCEKAGDSSGPHIERVRHHAEGSIRRNMAELRQLQADRHLNAKLDLDVPGIARVKDVLQGTALSRKLTNQSPPPAPAVAQVESRIAAIVTKEQEVHAANLKLQTHFAGATSTLSPGRVSMAKNAGQRTHFAGAVGRNTLCPCGSRLKHKRCCGQNAPPLHLAA